MTDQPFFPVPKEILAEQVPPLMLLADKSRQEAESIVQQAWTANMRAQGVISEVTQTCPPDQHTIVTALAFHFLHHAAASIMLHLAGFPVNVQYAPEVNKGSQFK